ncbi:protein tramtrack, alpha isoform-like isoform X2 [Harmonia axyridis]|uniref:protein tramtrack, alpha isoform-like isoform X2 n=1 Tax=Harmonia axyridis TaxID=115357 RepID=UPI001E27644E|nr:protein tramtrack, alpha isoform-like isoform X2 [Harmonia axyridis]
MEQVMQKYCLRWNNYQTNLVRVFDEMLKNENFTDVTIVCNDGIRFRCHRMLLAACSKFFQDLFISVPGDQHLVMLLKDVKHTDMKHILEYMYTGEVNVAQEEISSIIRTAEELKIKGLIGEDKVTKKEEEPVEEAPPSRPTSGHMHSNSNMHSPPHSNNAMYKNPYSNMYSKMHTTERNSMPMWHVPGLPLPPVAENPSSNHFSVPSPPNVMPTYEQHNQEVYHHRRKKFSSVMMPKDTPILRTVLGQGQTDSSQPVSLVMSHAETKDENQEQEPLRKHFKEEPQEDNDYHNEVDVKPRIITPSSSPVTYPTAGITTYAQAQKPETNKRYKQYSNNDLNQALDDVRSGMSALLASKRHNVPSRTLYDKVKKLGIIKTQSPPRVKLGKRSANGNPVEYNSDDRSVSPRVKSENEDYPINNNSSVTKAFLQHAGEDALKAMAYAASVAQVLQIPNNAFGGTRAAALRYLPYNRLSPANSDNRSGTPDKEEDYDEDHVEDLSINKRQEGVIMPPMNQVSSIVNEENQRSRKEDPRRNVEDTTT